MNYAPLKRSKDSASPKPTSRARRPSGPRPNASELAEAERRLRGGSSVHPGLPALRGFNPITGFTNGPPERVTRQSATPRATDSHGTAEEVPNPLAGISIAVRDFGKYIVIDEAKVEQSTVLAFSSALPAYEVIQESKFAELEKIWTAITAGSEIAIWDDNQPFGPLKKPVKEAIGTLLSKPEGRRTVIMLLEVSRLMGVSVNIAVTKEAMEYSREPKSVWIGLRPPIQYNPYDSPKNPFFIKVGHEMIHAIRTILDLPNSETDVMNNALKGLIPTEAGIRSEHNLPPRTKHGKRFEMPDLKVIK